MQETLEKDLQEAKEKKQNFSRTFKTLDDFKQYIEQNQHLYAK